MNRSTILEHGAKVSSRKQRINYHHILHERVHHRLAVAKVDLATIQRTNIRLERRRGCIFLEQIEVTYRRHSGIWDWTVYL